MKPKIYLRGCIISNVKLKRLTPLAIALIIVVVISGVVVAGSVYFYVLPQQGKGSYSGPGLPNPPTTFTYSISVSGYGNWTSYAFHSNVSEFTAENAYVSAGGSYSTAIYGLMNQSEYNNLTANTSLSWIVCESQGLLLNGFTRSITGQGNYYLVFIQEGTGSFSYSGKLSLTPVS